MKIFPVRDRQGKDSKNRKGGEFFMIEVKVTDPHNFEKAMRIFKKACQKDGFMMELKERRFYCKPSEKKRIKGGRVR